MVVEKRKRVLEGTCNDCLYMSGLGRYSQPYMTTQRLEASSTRWPGTYCNARAGPGFYLCQNTRPSSQRNVIAYSR